GVAGFRPVTRAFQELHGHQGVEKVLHPPGVQADVPPQLRARETSVAEEAEHAELHGGQENLGIPEGKCGLENRTRIELRMLAGHEGSMIGKNSRLRRGEERSYRTRAGQARTLTNAV